MKRILSALGLGAIMTAGFTGAGLVNAAQHATPVLARDRDDRFHDADARQDRRQARLAHQAEERRERAAAEERREARKRAYAANRARLYAQHRAEIAARNREHWEAKHDRR